MIHRAIHLQSIDSAYASATFFMLGAAAVGVLISSEVARKDPTRDSWTTLIRGCTLRLVQLGGAYLLLLASSLSFSDETAISKHLAEAAALGTFNQTTQFHVSPYGHSGHRYDLFSDCIGLGTNLRTEYLGLLRRIASTPYLTSSPQATAGTAKASPCQDLASAVDKDLSGAGKEHADFGVQPYERFWHGYQVYVRATLSLATFPTLRRINAVLLYGCVLAFAILIRQWLGLWAAAAFFVTYFMSSDLLSAPLLATQALPLAWSYFSAAWAMYLVDKYKGHSRSLEMFAFASGSIYNFISMLFTPQLVPALLAFVSLAGFLRHDGARQRRWWAMAHAATLALLWFAGFASTWLLKWGFAAAVLGGDAVVESVRVAASGSSYLSHSDPQLRAALPVLWTVLSRRTGSLIIASCAVALVGIQYTGSSDTREARRLDWLMMQSPALVIIGWTELFRFHSAEHSAFADRGLLLLAMLPLWGLFAVNDAYKASAESPPSAGRAPRVAQDTDVRRGTEGSAGSADAGATGQRLEVEA